MSPPAERFWYGTAAWVRRKWPSLRNPLPKCPESRHTGGTSVNAMNATTKLPTPARLVSETTYRGRPQVIEPPHDCPAFGRDAFQPPTCAPTYWSCRVASPWPVTGRAFKSFANAPRIAAPRVDVNFSQDDHPPLAGPVYFPLANSPITTCTHRTMSAPSVNGASGGTSRPVGSGKQPSYSNRRSLSIKCQQLFRGIVRASTCK